jgi:hypothetical protein
MGVGHMTNVDVEAGVSSIDDVIGRLHEIVARSTGERDQLGVFAALYQRVTVRVKEGIGSGRFDDPARMERLDVVFANRYFEAIELFRRGLKPSLCWLVSFEAAKGSLSSKVRHMLAGMNAHINLDLGVATAQTCSQDQLPSLKRDFFEINRILSEVFIQVRGEIDQCWSWITLVDQVDPKIDDAVVRLCLGRARARAWRVAEQLASLGPDEWEPEINRLDRKAAIVGGLICNPFAWLSRLRT